MAAARTMIEVPPGWTLADYKKKNDELASVYGEPASTTDKHLAQARQHLRRYEERRDVSARCSELHSAVSAMLAAIEQGRAGR